MVYLTLLACLNSEEPPEETESSSTKNTVVMETTLGTITIELDPEMAPITTNNFKEYVRSGFYDGSDGLDPTIFHRVIDDFMIQGGGFTETGTEKETSDPIKNEASQSGLSNVRGTIAMARTSIPDSATAQFYINVVDNTFLDATDSDAGYAVFGTVTNGMDIADSIAVVPVRDDKPLEDVVITSVILTD